MRDKRPVDELSIEELERVLAIRKREERQKQLARMQRSGRVIPPQGTDEKPKNQPVVIVTEKPKNSDAVVLAPQPITAPATLSQPVTSPHFEDELDAPEYTPRHAEDSNRIWRAFVNRSLLLVEVLAVVGLILLGVNLFDAVNKLERESAEAAQAADEIRRTGIPTIAPTPVLRLEQYVLPGGHTIVNNVAQFNYNEVPDFLRAMVQMEINQPELIYRPPETDETAVVLSIPRLGLDQTIVQGVDWEALKQGVGQLVNGVNPGDPTGNVVLSAHNDVYGEYFRYLDTMVVGDRFTVQTRTHVYTYEVTGFDIVEPTDVYVMANLDRPTATLISCYPYQVDNQRYVVFADRVDE
jgi:sortase A